MLWLQIFKIEERFISLLIPRVRVTQFVQVVVGLFGHDADPQGMWKSGTEAAGSHNEPGLRQFTNGSMRDSEWLLLAEQTVTVQCLLKSVLEQTEFMPTIIPSMRFLLASEEVIVL